MSYKTSMKTNDMIKIGDTLVTVTRAVDNRVDLTIDAPITTHIIKYKQDAKNVRYSNK